MIISFVIPVYNAREYIKDCVKSIQNAIDKGHLLCEIILVDDGSCDGSAKACDDLQGQDDRIRVIHQENAGLCTARNVGLDNALGEWICFLDHDDLLDENAVAVMEKSLNTEAEIIYFGYEKFTKDIPLQNKGNFDKTIEYRGENIKKLQWDCLCRYKHDHPLIDYMLLTTPWGKIYNRQYLYQNGLRFIEGLHREEDVSFNLMCLANLKCAWRIPYSICYHRVFEASESHSYKEHIYIHANEILEAYSAIINKYYKDDARMKELYDFRVMWELLYCVILGVAHPDNPKTYREKKRDFKELVSSDRFKDAFKNSNINKLPLQHRILGLCIKYKWVLGTVILTKIKCKVLGLW